MIIKRLLVGLLCATLAACGTIPNFSSPPTPTPVGGSVVVREPLSPVPPSLPSVNARATQFAGSLTQTDPVLLLPNLDANQARAQTLALSDPRFLSNAYTTQGQPLRSEIFNIYPARESDLTDDTARCATSNCYRVELYNYALNGTAVAIVDIDNGFVLAVNIFPDAQPDIPLHLQQLALDIATNAPQVIDALGFQPSADKAVMESTKTSLNLTRCQRSHHLCVAPTFVQGERALWAIVDLTDMMLVGVRWTDLGETPEGAVTERSLQNDVVTALYCERNTPFARDGWALDYMLTSSDGLRVANVQYKDAPVLDSAKLVDFHVSYSTQDGFGYSDAVGCPAFSQAAVIAFQGPVIEDLRDGDTVVGFALVQKFWSDLWPLPCNYYYVQRYEFYNDGRFRVVGGNVGRGCGDAGTYRPVMRIAFAGTNTVAAWDGSAWKDWATETWTLQDEGAYTDDGYQYRIANTTGNGYYLEPGQGQFNDGGRGDHAYVYVTQKHADIDEGDADLITIGPCCNNDFAQGPEKFINDEPILVTNLVLWYVPQIEISGQAGSQYCWADSILQNGVYAAQTYPCYAGPMFVPIAD